MCKLPLPMFVVGLWLSFSSSLQAKPNSTIGGIAEKPKAEGSAEGAPLPSNSQDEPEKKAQRCRNLKLNNSSAAEQINSVLNWGQAEAHRAYAAHLLRMPVGAPAPAPATFWYHVLKNDLQTLAVRWEILDQREVHYIVSSPEELEKDLNLLRRRFHELEDAPALDDSLRFPDRETINDLLAFNRLYRANLVNRQPVELVRCWELRAAMQETEYLYMVWDTVRDARCEYYYVTVRRQALKKLHKILGDEAYYFGQLPPPVPIWRFQEID